MSDYYYSFKGKGFFWQPDTESGDVHYGIANPHAPA